MVLIGFDFQVSQEAVNEFFKSYEIEYCPAEYSYRNYRFFEIQTALMRKNSLCCLGRSTQIVQVWAKLIDDPEDPNSLRIKKLYEQDIAFWKALIVDLIQQFGEAVIMRFYKKTNASVTVDRMELRFLSAQMLLFHEVNNLCIWTKDLMDCSHTPHL